MKTLIVLLFAASPALLGGGAIASALPLISEAFPDVPETLVSLLITLPPLATALSGFFIGAVSDRFGRIKTLVASIIVFGLCGGIGFFLDDFYAILFFRFWCGVGIAGIMPVVITILTEYFSGPTLARYLGYNAAAMGAGGTVLGICCGFLAGISWNAVFLVYFAVLLVIPFILFALKEPEHLERKAADSKPAVSKGKAAGVIIFVYLSMIICQMLLYSMTTKTPYLLAEMGGISTAMIGFLVALVGIFTAISGAFYGRVLGRLSYTVQIGLMILLEAAGLLLIATCLNLVVIGIGIALLGLGIGIGAPVGARWIAEVTSPRIRGRVMGGMSAATYGGQFCATAITALVLLFVPDYSGMYLVIGLGALALALGIFVFSFAVKHRKPAA